MPLAKRLGAAFRKADFLRDLQNEMENLSPRYFPNIILCGINEKIKKSIIDDIRNDFSIAYTGIRKLPLKARSGVLIAFKFHRKLLSKSERTPADKLLMKRVRVPGSLKLVLLPEAGLKNRLNMV